MGKIKNREFYEQDAVTIAKELLGKLLCRKIDGESQPVKYRIIETEAYMDKDAANYGIKEVSGDEVHYCHTEGTKVLFNKGGCASVYGGMLIVVAGEENSPQNVLIRGVDGSNGSVNGPVNVAATLKIDKTLNGESLTGDKIWIEDDGVKIDKGNITETCRKNLSETLAQSDRCQPWRFILKK